MTLLLRPTRPNQKCFLGTQHVPFQSPSRRHRGKTGIHPHLTILKVRPLSTMATLTVVGLTETRLRRVPATAPGPLSERYHDGESLRVVHWQTARAALTIRAATRAGLRLGDPNWEAFLPEWVSLSLTRSSSRSLHRLGLG